MAKDKFYSGIRVELEENGTNLISKQVLNQIRALETKAAELREQGQNPRMVLRDQVDELAAKATMGNRNLLEAYNDQFENMKAEHQKYVEKHPQQRLAKLQEARLNVDMMSDEEIKEKANSYRTNPGPMDELTAKEMAARLNKIDPADAKAFKEAAESQQAFSPWLQNSEAQSMLKDAETVKNLKPGHIAISGDMQAPIHNLIDFDGELDVEIT